MNVFKDEVLGYSVLHTLHIGIDRSPNSLEDMCLQIEAYLAISPGGASLHNANALLTLRRSSHVKRQSISETIAAATNPHVVPTTSSFAGDLSAETLQPTPNSKRICDTCSVGINGAHTLGRVHALSSPCLPTSRKAGWCCNFRKAVSTV